MIDRELDPIPKPSPALAGSDTRVRYRVLGAICLLALIAYLHRVGFATAAPELKSRLGLTDKQLSYLMGAFMLSYGVVEIPFGVLSDRFGVRNLLCILVLAWSVLTALLAGAIDLPVHTIWPMTYLLVLRVLFGITQGGMFPSTSRMFADWMPVDERGLAQGCLWTSSRIGGAVAPLVVVYLFGKLGVGHAAFASMAALGGIWIAGFWPWFRNTPETMPGVSPAEIQRIHDGRPPRKTEYADCHGHSHAAPGVWRAMLESRSVWCLCLTYGAIGLTGNFFTTMLPTYLRTHLGFTAEVAGRISAVPLGVGVVACLVGGYVSDQIIRLQGNRGWGRRLVGAVGLTLGAVGMAVAVTVHDPFWLAVVLGVAFFGNDLAMGPAWAAAADIGERSAGTLGGTMNMVGSMTGALGAVLAGHLLDEKRIVLLFAILASSYALGAVLWLGVDVRKTLATAGREGT